MLSVKMLSSKQQYQSHEKCTEELSWKVFFPVGESETNALALAKTWCAISLSIEVISISSSLLNTSDGASSARTRRVVG